MANLAQQAEELTWVPKQQLINWAQFPDQSRYPAILVLSEIQGRTKLEQLYNEQLAAMQQPTTTVAEDVVSNFAQPEGLAGMNTSGSAPADMSATAEADVFSPEAMPATLGLPQQLQEDVQQVMPETPMQQMAASGGRTGYFAMGSTQLPSQGSRASLEESFVGPTQDDSIEISSIPEDERLAMADAGQKLTPAQKWMIGLNTAALAMLVTPVPGARIASGATKALQLAIRAGTGIKGAYQARKAKILMDQGRKAILKGKVSGQGPTGGLLNNPIIVREAGKEAIKQMRIPQRIAGGTLLGGTTYGLLDQDSPLSIRPRETEDENGGTPNENNEELSEDIIDHLNTKQPQTKGLFSGLKQAEGLDVAQLGGVIMGARNMSELGAGIAGIAANIQDRRTKDKLAEIQGGLYEAQTDHYRAQIESMEPEQIVAMLEQVNDAIKLIQEGSSDESDITDLVLQRELLIEKYNDIKGYEIKSEAERLQEALDAAETK